MWNQINMKMKKRETYNMVDKKLEAEARKTLEEAKKDLGAAAVDAEGFFKKHKAVVIVAGLVLVAVLGFFIIF